ncbi:hypothetical protein [Nocardia asiatica]|uniref:hypothetical protein n=1 Tax=Nocardia asiatica TaxID=209252 RepID=UPI003EDF846D
MRHRLKLLQGGASDQYDAGIGLDEFYRRWAHDNPAWPVSSRKAAVQAFMMHEDCDPLECSTRVAADIVSRDNYRYFRDRGM